MVAGGRIRPKRARCRESPRRECPCAGGETRPRPDRRGRVWVLPGPGPSGSDARVCQSRDFSRWGTTGGTPPSGGCSIFGSTEMSPGSLGGFSLDDGVVVFGRAGALPTMRTSLGSDLGGGWIPPVLSAIQPHPPTARPVPRSTALSAALCRWRNSLASGYPGSASGRAGVGFIAVRGW